MALFIVTPDLPRLLNVFASNRPAGTSTVPALFRRHWANWTAVILQAVLGFYILGAEVKDNADLHKEYYGAPKSPFYGIWDVGKFSIDGQEHPPLLTDGQRWHRVLMEYATSIRIQNMTEDFSKRFLIQISAHCTR